MRRVMLLICCRVRVDVMQKLQGVPEQVLVSLVFASLRLGLKKHRNVVFTILRQVRQFGEFRHGFGQRSRILTLHIGIKHFTALFRHGAEKTRVFRVNHLLAQGFVRCCQPCGRVRRLAQRSPSDNPAFPIFDVEHRLQYRLISRMRQLGSWLGDCRLLILLP